MKKTIKKDKILYAAMGAAMDGFAEDINKAQKESKMKIREFVCWIFDDPDHSEDVFRAIKREHILSQYTVDTVCRKLNWDRTEHYMPDYIYENLCKGGTRKSNDIVSEVVEAPIEPIVIDFTTPSYEEFKPEETINENDELVTKGMLKDYIRDLLLSFLEGIV